MGEGFVPMMMLVCAVLLSLGVGVLAAHALVEAMFAAFRTHARQVAEARGLKTSAPAPARLEEVRG